MGQQQLLLIVLVVIVVGIAVAIGMNMFSESAAQANFDAVISDMLRDRLERSAVVYEARITRRWRSFFCSFFVTKYQCEWE